MELDGAFSVSHINYGKSPVFDGIDGKNIAIESRRNSITTNDKVDDVLNSINAFNGAEKDFGEDDVIQLWEMYWLEYINAFDKLTLTLPNSVVTIFLGRHAVELGIKYLLAKKDKKYRRS